MCKHDAAAYLARHLQGIPRWQWLDVYDNLWHKITMSHRARACTCPLMSWVTPALCTFPLMSDLSRCR